MTPVAFCSIIHVLQKEFIVTRIRRFIVSLLHDLGQVRHTLWHDRSIQIVVFLSLLPWAISIYRHRDPSVWLPLTEILGLMVFYWFLTRGRPIESLPVRRPLLESGLAIGLALIWIIYRTLEYTHVIVFPSIHLGLCDDLLDTIIPKTIEMTLLPFFLFLALGYGFTKQGLGLPKWAWIPAILPLLVFVGWGLSHQKPEGLATRTTCFYFGAGLPEEFLFRALIMSRLEALTRRPVWGLFLSAFVFGATHIPIDLEGAGLANWPNALENAFTFQMSIGLCLGYAFLRVRNIWPLTFIHALIDSAP